MSLLLLISWILLECTVEIFFQIPWRYVPGGAQILCLGCDIFGRANRGLFYAAIACIIDQYIVYVSENSEYAKDIMKPLLLTMLIAVSFSVHY